MKKSREDNELGKRIGKQLAKKRTDAGLTQEYVATALDVTVDSVSRMERGLSLPNVAKLIRLAELYGCGADELLLLTSPRPQDKEKVLVNQFKRLCATDRELLIKFADMLEAHKHEPSRK